MGNIEPMREIQKGKTKTQKHIVNLRSTILNLDCFLNGPKQ